MPAPAFTFADAGTQTWPTDGNLFVIIRNDLAGQHFVPARPKTPEVVAADSQIEIVEID